MGSVSQEESMSRSLPQPPVSNVRTPLLSSLTDPLSWAAAVLQGQSAVRVKTILSSNMAVVATVDLIKEVLASEAKGQTATIGAAADGLLLGSHSLYAQPHKRHLAVRRLLAPAFSSEAMQQYTPQLARLAHKYLDRVASSPSGTADVAPLLRLFTFEIISSVVIGLQLDAAQLALATSAFQAWMVGFIDPLRWDLPFTPWGRALASRRRLKDLVRRQMAQSEGTAGGGEGGEEGDGEGGGGRASVLQALMAARGEGGDSLSDDEVIDNMLFLLLAGHDTTSGALAGLLVQLAESPQVVDRLVAEQQQVLERHGEELSPAALADMSYLEATILESMRVQPPASMTLRTIMDNFTAGGFQFLKGRRVNLALGIAMRGDPRWLDAPPELSPDRFNPDRWDGKNPRAGLGGSQLTFGAGSRMCVGMWLALLEMRVFLALMLRQYDFSLPFGAKIRKGPLVAASGEMKLRLVPRGEAGSAVGPRMGKPAAWAGGRWPLVLAVLVALVAALLALTLLSSASGVNTRNGAVL